MMNQNKEYIEKLMKEFYYKNSYRPSLCNNSMKEHLELLYTCNKDKNIIKSIIPKLSGSSNLYIIGIVNNWQSVEIIYHYDDDLDKEWYIGRFFRGDLMKDLKTKYYLKVRENRINNIINEKEI